MGELYKFIQLVCLSQNLSMEMIIQNSNSGSVGLLCCAGSRSFDCITGLSDLILATCQQSEKRRWDENVRKVTSFGLLWKIQPESRDNLLTCGQ